MVNPVSPLRRIAAPLTGIQVEVSMLSTRAVRTALGLRPGEAVHLGHSCLLLNVAGLRLLFDPATLTGRAAAPFANLTARAATTLVDYEPLVPHHVLPAPRVLAEAADVIVYSHTHADHFNAAVLARLFDHNPQLRVIWPAGTPRLLYGPRRALARQVKPLLRLLNGRFGLDTVAAGLQEYLTTAAPHLPLGQTREADAGQVIVLRQQPRVELHVFAVRHPRPLLWVPTPFEPAFPPVLGFEIRFESDDDEAMADRGPGSANPPAMRRLIVVPETALDAGMLARLWQAGDALQAAYLPADPMPAWFRIGYEFNSHASPRLFALAERLVADHTRLYPLHHGLWLHRWTADDLRDSREWLAQTALRTPAPATDLAGLLAACQRHTVAPYALTAGRAWQALVSAIARRPLEVDDKIRVPAVGQVHTL